MDIKEELIKRINRIFEDTLEEVQNSNKIDKLDKLNLMMDILAIWTGNYEKEVL